MCNRDIIKLFFVKDNIESKRWEKKYVHAYVRTKASRIHESESRITEGIGRIMKRIENGTIDWIQGMEEIKEQLFNF